MVSTKSASLASTTRTTKLGTHLPLRQGPRNYYCDRSRSTYCSTGAVFCLPLTGTSQCYIGVFGVIMGVSSEGSRQGLFFPSRTVLPRVPLGRTVLDGNEISSWLVVKFAAAESETTTWFDKASPDLENRESTRGGPLTQYTAAPPHLPSHTSTPSTLTFPPQ